MSSGNSEFPKRRNRSRGRALGVHLNRCLTFMVKQIRRPLIAYVVVLSAVMLAFGLFQFNVNERLQNQDYTACIERNKILTQANERNSVLVTRDGTAVKPYKLSNCQSLKP